FQRDEIMAGMSRHNCFWRCDIGSGCKSLVTIASALERLVCQIPDSLLASRQFVGRPLSR
ncbi:MAG: hypothetical protein ACPGCY_02630, partial [Henriciella sp.]